MSKRLVRVSAAVLSLSLLAAACGGDDDSSDDTPAEAPAEERPTMVGSPPTSRPKSPPRSRPTTPVTSRPTKATNPPPTVRSSHSRARSRSLPARSST